MIAAGSSTDEVLDALSRLVTSAPLQSSPLICKILQYVVHEELDGRGDQIKAFSIALDAMDRPATFDPQTDPAVRVNFGRLRTALDLYYADEGKDDPVKIVFPKGRYRPTFIPNPAPSPGAAVAASRWKIALPALAIVVLAALAAWPYFSRKSPPEASFLIAPRVAIAGFRNSSGRKDLENFVYGLQFDLVSELSRFSWLSVFVGKPAKNAVPAQANGKPADLRSGSDYLMTGTINVTGDQLIVSYQLLETASGIVRWAQTFDRSLSAEAIFDIQREAATAIAVEIGRPEGIVKQLEKQRYRHRTNDLSAYLCTLEIYRYWDTFAADDHLRSRTCLEAAVETDPGYAEARAALSFIYLDEDRYGYNKRQGYDPLKRSTKAASQAVKLDPFSTLAKQAMFTVSLYTGNLEKFIEIGRNAIALAPNNPELLADFGNKLALEYGSWTEGLQHSSRALSLNPHPAPWYFLSSAFAAIVSRDYQKAVQISRRINTPNWFSYNTIRAIGFAGLKDRENTKQALEQLALIGSPDFRATRQRIIGLRYHKELETVLIDRLKQAYEFAGPTI